MQLPVASGQPYSAAGPHARRLSIVLSDAVSRLEDVEVSPGVER